MFHIYITNSSDYMTLAKIWQNIFIRQNFKSAGTVALLSPPIDGLLIEIDCIAMLPTDK